MAIIVDGVSCKMEPNWAFLGVVWATWGPFLDAQAGLWRYLDSVLGRLSKSCGVEGSSRVNFDKFYTILDPKIMLKGSLDPRAKTKSRWVPI